MRDAGYGEGEMRGCFGSAAGVSIAGGAREGGLIVVGVDRSGEKAVEGAGEIDAFCAVSRF
jgi:hypothetical protein